MLILTLKRAMETRTIYNLGNVFLGLGDLKNGTEWHRQALNIRRSYYGNQNHNTACSQYKLGVLAEQEGNDERAA